MSGDALGRVEMERMIPAEDVGDAASPAKDCRSIGLYDKVSSLVCRFYDRWLESTLTHQDDRLERSSRKNDLELIPLVDFTSLLGDETDALKEGLRPFGIAGKVEKLLYQDTGRSRRSASLSFGLDQCGTVDGLTTSRTFAGGAAISIVVLTIGMST